MSLFHPLKYLILAMLFAGAAVPRQNQEWKLVFEDNFDGTSVDTTHWAMYDGPGHAGNGLRKPSAFTVRKGLLMITAQMQNGRLVSGGMAHKGNFRYGKFAFRVRTEPDPSGATSGVVLTWPQSERWPQDGENDMYETGQNPRRKPFETFIHYGDRPETQYHFRHEADAKAWHIIEMEWSADQLILFRDGKRVWTLDDKDAIPDVPHHLCLQLDAFKKSMGNPVRMYVDWVRVYQRR
ncbi:MAG: glycoside hydrolase family 16 protein [Mucilaginibacter polytrichastri]|nr:glycoside hydrolase family 16 protein [Mucilaginibacter polytrichastri]